MRWPVSFFLTAICSLALISVSTAGTKDTRFAIDLDRKGYPQTTPKVTLESILKVLKRKDYDYLLAHLADPAYVDEKVTQLMKDFDGPESARRIVAFEKFAKLVKLHFQNDPSLARALRALAKDGVWEPGDQTVSVGLPNATGQRAYFRFVKGRWFLENRRHAKNGAK